MKKVDEPKTVHGLVRKEDRSLQETPRINIISQNVIENNPLADLVRQEFESAFPLTPSLLQPEMTKQPNFSLIQQEQLHSQ
ncbi:MAG: hypothetical protein NTV80_12800 [Verrucomicrobia bacterium]|nr:hypothetical protein [Verrucomicrobiota bacterium]